MNTLVLRHVPGGLYRRLEAVAAGLPGGPPTQRPNAEETRRWLEQQVWALPEKLTPLQPRPSSPPGGLMKPQRAVQGVVTAKP